MVLVVLASSTVGAADAARLPEDVTVEGRVTDPRGTPVEGAIVHDQPPQVGTAYQTTTTDADGRYAFEVAAGTHVHLIVFHRSFDPYEQGFVADDDTVHDVVLTYRVSRWSETVGDTVTFQATTPAPRPGESSCVRFATERGHEGEGEHVGAGVFRWSLDVADEPEGTFTAYVTVVDCDDPSSVLSSTAVRNALWYRVDRTAPVVLATAPSAPTRGDVVIRVETRDGDLDPEGSTVLVDGGIVTGRAFDHEWDLAAPVGELTSGVHTATVVLRDRAGNEAAPFTFEWRVDVDGPSLVDVAPAGVVDDRRPVLSFVADDGDGVGVTHGGAVLELTDALGTTTKLWPVYDPGTGRFTASRRLPLLVDGVHRVRVTVQDRLGNVTTSTWTFELRTLTPG